MLEGGVDLCATRFDLKKEITHTHTRIHTRIHTMQYGERDVRLVCMLLSNRMVRI